MTDPQMTPDERRYVLDLLAETRDTLLAVAEPLTDVQWTRVPGPDRWSVGQIVEHLGIVETGLFRRVERALMQPANPEWVGQTGEKTELIERQLRDRGLTRDAPERVVPSGTMTRDDAMTRYRDGRVQSIAFAERTNDPLKLHTSDHHRPVIGTLNAYQWLLYIPLHNLRHNQQIAEAIAIFDL